MSHLFTVVKRKQKLENPIIARSESIKMQMLREKADANQGAKASSAGQQNGRRQMNKRMLLLRELSESVKSVPGSIGTNNVIVLEYWTNSE